MKLEKKLTITKGERVVKYVYYVKKVYSKEFECDMYNVGVKTDDKQIEINDFSPSLHEAEMLCDYLYDENVSPDNLFLAAEEFIVTQ